MFGTHDLVLFMTSGILLNLTPGQDTFYILGRTIAQGRRAGILSVFGIISGCVVHTVAAAFGLAAILATSASAFIAVKLLGAAYLVYLGVRMLVDRPATGAQPSTFVGERSWAIYRAGFLTNVLNPKVALFFLAFLPQFVDPASDARITAFLFLGALFISTGALWCLVLVWSASAMSRHFRGNPSVGSGFKRAGGALFVGLGVKLAVSK